jgi:hypothetical protein
MWKSRPVTLYEVICIRNSISDIAMKHGVIFYYSDNARFRLP